MTEKIKCTIFWVFHFVVLFLLYVYKNFMS